MSVTTMTGGSGWVPPGYNPDDIFTTFGHTYFPKNTTSQHDSVKQPENNHKPPVLRRYLEPIQQATAPDFPQGLPKFSAQTNQHNYFA